MLGECADRVYMLGSGLIIFGTALGRQLNMALNDLTDRGLVATRHEWNEHELDRFIVRPQHGPRVPVRQYWPRKYRGLSHSTMELRLR